ncbi:uncharacterized protein FOBCDRAFT_204035 [Fusarium oxysporum Fo47]|uniref:uncharacterized protein n=1 Tax=Fusarium oxysporum Fo47 TaxID=660027 RepID=UPI002869D717|nr:uncharacterized protein FOBCDRAFT_204035 [Fusarium oxysporum Fo47]WJG35701.1 hypothetical protein FOBCDRAFT_204035 [Fusarium oxysporum Fo47]
MERPLKRGQPRKYATAKEKATADTQRRQNKRQEVAAQGTALPYSNFYNLHLPPTTSLVNYGHPIQQLDNSESSLAAGLDNDQDISNFLPPPSPLLQPTTEGLSLNDDEPVRVVSIISSNDSVSISNHESPDQVQDITFNTTLETSSQVGNSELDPVRHLAQELAEQLVKFQGCCDNCHLAAQSNHMEDPNERTSLAMYLKFIPEFGPDVLSQGCQSSQCFTLMVDD